jgi:hypothetical protein
MEEQRMSTIDEHWVYVIHAPKAGTFKIGRSNTEHGAQVRIKTHQTSSGERLNLLGVFSSRQYGTESHLHTTFADHRTHGEWFTATRDTARLLRDKLGITIPPTADETPATSECFPLLSGGELLHHTLTPPFEVTVDLVRNPGHPRVGHMCAHYELWYDPITDDYSPQDISARDLYQQWRKHVVNSRYGDFIPIIWFVSGPGIFESHPLYEHDYKQDGYDDHFTEPQRTDGQHFDWDDLPIIRKRWNTNDKVVKGGFVEELTGWRPQSHQMWVSLDEIDQLVKRKA